MALRFVHCSDIHLLELVGGDILRFFNKRLTGGVNLLLHRGHKHSGGLFDQIVQHARDYKADRLVITGDVTNLALATEFELVRRKLRAAGLPVTVIPGNHDTYTRGSARSRRFEQYMAEFMEGERAGADYPFAQRLGDVALVGVSTAIPSLPLHAIGEVGADQRARLGSMLAALGREQRTRIVLIHHPVMPGVAKFRHHLVDREAFAAVIAEHGAELILHGHEHRRIDGDIPGPHGPVVVHGIGSGTYLSQTPGRHGAFSLYDVAAGAITRVYHTWDGSRFVAEPVATIRRAAA